MAARDADPFGSLNRVLDSRHTQPGAIKKACLAIEDCIVNNRDNLRGFFDKCFPNLLKRIFGYDDFEASWLNMVTKAGKEEDAKALVSLLHPQGKLFASMHRADSESLIRFIFPVERLPGHTQALLATVAGRKELESWPQYKGHIVSPELSAVRRTQVFMDVFTYYMFWTAFYVLRGNRSEEPGLRAAATAGYSGASGIVGGAASSMGSMGVGGAAQHTWGLSELRRLGGTLMAGLTHPGGPPLHRHPYYTLLRLYLEHFMPAAGGTAGGAAACGEEGAGGARGLGGVQGAGAGGAVGDGGAGGAGSKPSLGQVVLNVLLEFWLTDVSEPVPAEAGALPDKAGVAAAGAGGAAAAAAGAGMLVGAAGAGAAGAVAAGNAAAASGASIRALSYQPPSEDLVEALVHLVRYITVIEPHKSTPQQQQHHRLAAVGLQAAAAASKQLLHPGAAAAAATGGKGASVGEPMPAQAGKPWLPEVQVRTSPPPPSPRLLLPQPPGSLLAGPPSSPSVQLVSRKLYRFLRRTLTHWPLPSSASLTPVITLWLSIIAPWAPRPQPPAASTSSHNHHPTLGTSGRTDSGTLHGPGGGGFGSAFAAGPSVSGGGDRAVQSGQYREQYYGGPAGRPKAAGAGAASSRLPRGRYTPAWRQHVLAHLPFYTILIPRFLELTYARQAFRSDAALVDLLLLLQPLADSPELVKELQEAEAAVNSYLAAPLRRPEGPYADMLAWAVEQAHDWEAAAVAGVQQGEMRVDPAYRLFVADGSRGAASYALAVLRAAEAQLVRPELREAVREAAAAVLPLQGAAAALMRREEALGIGGAGGAAAAQLPGPSEQPFPRAGHWQDLHYHGDWLKRPIASNEIGPLVRVLVYLSESLNQALGLTGPLRPGEEDEMVETLGQQAVRWLRRRGVRINLRPLAEKQVLAWLLVLYLLCRLFFGGTSATPVAAPVAQGTAPWPQAPVLPVVPEPELRGPLEL